MREIDFDNITPADIHNITKEDINEFTGEQFIKYKEALNKYKGLRAASSGYTKVNDLISDMCALRHKINDDTILEVRVQDECGREYYINTRHCKLSHYDSISNRVVLSNYKEETK